MRNAAILIITLFLFNSCVKNDQNNIKTVAFISLSEVDKNTFNGFKEEMSDLGWNENIKFIVNPPAKKVSNLESIVKKTLEKSPDLILVSSTPATKTVKQFNKNIPVVFCPVNDPVASGIMNNTIAPEGNITGVRLPIGDEKRTEWLYKIIPELKNVLVPYTKNDDSSLQSRKDIKQIANNLKFNIIEKPLEDPGLIKKYLKEIPKNIDAIILPRDSIIESKAEQFIEFTLKNKIPLSVPSYQHVQKGALFTYGFIHKELGKDAAKIVDKILKGVKVKDLPVKFGQSYLVVNKKTAEKIKIKLNDDVFKNAKIIVE